jgi:hypothetical protein
LRLHTGGISSNEGNREYLSRQSGGSREMSRGEASGVSTDEEVDGINALQILGKWLNDAGRVRPSFASVISVYSKRNNRFAKGPGGRTLGC